MSGSDEDETKSSQWVSESDDSEEEGPEEMDLGAMMHTLMGRYAGGFDADQRKEVTRHLNHLHGN